MRAESESRRRRRRIRLVIRRTAGVLSFVSFFLMFGAVGAVECDTVPLFEGAVRMFGFQFMGIGFAVLAGVFQNPKERRNRYEVRRDTVSRSSRTGCQKSSSTW